MKRKFITVTILLICVAVVLSSCQPLKKYPYTKKDVLPIGALIAGTIADMASTRYAVDRGLVELNPLMGKKPSNEVLITVGTLKLATMLFFGRYTLPKTRRWIFSGTAAFNSGTALYNVRLTNSTLK